MKFTLLFLFFFISISLFAQQPMLQQISTTTSASFRGLSVIDNNRAWLSGSQGCVGHTTDGGKSWNFIQVKGFENADFRSIYAFDSRQAIIANAGSPAYILSTVDGGQNWKSVYVNSHKDAFFDGVDFWNNKEGIIYGDPIDGKMLLLYTKDGGMNWEPLHQAPNLEKGEASFAASGTGVRCFKKKRILITTGGAVSRLWSSKDKGLHWSALRVPIIQGKSSTGIFSIAKNNESEVIVGGDYLQEQSAENHVFFSKNNGENWFYPKVPTRGFRECIELISRKTLIATGPSGTDISIDNGITWSALSDENGLHVVRKARKGSLVILAGNKGKVFLVK